MQRIHLLSALTALIVGCAVVVIALFFPPQGEIHSSVLILYGETLTFVGAILGVDYHHRYK